MRRWKSFVFAWLFVHEHSAWKTPLEELTFSWRFILKETSVQTLSNNLQSSVAQGCFFPAFLHCFFPEEKHLQTRCVERRCMENLTNQNSGNLNHLQRLNERIVLNVMPLRSVNEGFFSLSCSMHFNLGKVWLPSEVAGRSRNIGSKKKRY